ncbi:MAG: hypothetical protein M3503_00745 [Actinomycetota bacterium]|nr:hypothetical protein [Actinomycetota bacterium]
MRYGIIDCQYGQRMLATPPEEDGPVWMVNLMQYRARADDGDGDGGRTGRQADDEYAPIDVLRAIGARIVFVADVEEQLLGAEPQWDRVAVVRYASRRSFVEMQSRPDFQAKHVHKEAGMAATIIVGCVPGVTPQVPDAPDWSTVAHPPTDGDGPVVLMHVLRFAERERMRSYEQAAGAVGVPHGVRPTAWLDAEGTIIGDGREWDQVRFNTFPSRRAFGAVVKDRSRLAAQEAHREPAIADTYTLVLRPTTDHLAESLATA